jgi:ubiquinone/menaquinone biosynthesis C-methylase UbiE
VDPHVQRRVQRYGWDKAAASYEEYWAQQLAPARDRLFALAALGPGSRVLDVACGTGLVTFRAADAVGAGGRVVATDISGAMVEHVREQAAIRGATQVTACRCDAEALQLGEDDAFDVALCALGLMYVVEPVRALQQMYGALRDGGRIVVAVWGPRASCGWAEIFPIVEQRVASDVCPLFFQLGTGDSLRAALGAARFMDIGIERLRASLQYVDGDAACGAIRRAHTVGRPSRLPRLHRLLPTRQRLRHPRRVRRRARPEAGVAPDSRRRSYPRSER